MVAQPSGRASANTGFPASRRPKLGRSAALPVGRRGQVLGRLSSIAVGSGEPVSRLRRGDREFRPKIAPSRARRRQFEPVSAAFFCPVHRFIRSFHYQLWVIAGVRECRHADRDGNFRKISVGMPNDEPLDLVPQFLGSACRCLKGRSGQNDNEFLAAEPARNILVAEGGLQAVADGTQHRITGIMSMVVVEFFKVIDVDGYQADGLSGPPRP